MRNVTLDIEVSAPDGAAGRIVIQAIVLLSARIRCAILALTIADHNGCRSLASLFRYQETQCPLLIPAYFP